MVFVNHTSSHRLGEEHLGNLQNLKLHESFEEHPSASFKKNVSNDESEAVKKVSERPSEA